MMEIRDRQIVLDYQKRIKLTIGDLSIFPSGYERLRLWDAAIVLARYALNNREQFHEKEVLQLLAGTGITSRTLKKFAKPFIMAATDRDP